MPTLPITWGQQLAFTAAAKAALARLGIVARGPTDAEIVQFATSGMDAEAIADFYSFLPEFVAHNPGLPYGMGAEEYRQAIAGYASALQGSFGPNAGAAPPTPRSKGERESSLVGYALQNRVSAQQFGSTVEEFRQARGGPPGVAEFKAQFNRPQQRVAQGAGSQESTPTPRERTPEARVTRAAV